jgi:DNA-binding MarR family transcriptional regulator
MGAVTQQFANGYERNSPYRLIHDVYVLLDYGDRLVLDSFGLTPTEFRLLNLIDPDTGHRLTTLSDRLLRSKSQVTRVVDSLEGRDLVQRRHDPGDRRAQKVVLTKEGQSLRENINKSHLKSLEARFGSLGDAERDALIKTLDHLKHGMASYLKLE